MKQTTNHRGSRTQVRRSNDLAFERRVRKLTRKQVHRITGIKASTLASYERGKRLPSLTAALRLQILYRGQIASFYQPLYAQLGAEIRESEARVMERRLT